MLGNILKVLSSNFLKVIITLVTTFILPKFIPIEAYADIKSYQLYLTYTGLLHLGFVDGAYLEYGGKNIKDEKIKKEVSIEFFSLVIFQIVVMVLGMFVIESKNDMPLFFAVLATFPTIMFTYYSYICQAIGDFDNYSKLINMHTFFLLIANVIILLCKNQKSGLFIAIYVIFLYIISFIAMVIFVGCYKISFGGISYVIIRERIRNGFWLMLGNFSYGFLIGIDKLFVKSWFSTYDFAYYSFACQMITIINMFITPISLTMYNYMHQKKDTNFVKIIKGRIVTIILMLIAFYYPMNYVIVNFLPEYTMALKTLSLLLISQVFISINTSIFVNLYKVYKMQKKYFAQLIITILFSIILNIVLGRLTKSLYGVAIATVISSVIWYFLNVNQFKDLKVNVTQMGGMGTLLIIFLLTANYTKTLVGFIIYIASGILYILIFEKEVVEYIVCVWSKLMQKVRKLV